MKTDKEILDFIRKFTAFLQDVAMETGGEFILKHTAGKVASEEIKKTALAMSEAIGGIKAMDTFRMWYEAKGEGKGVGVSTGVGAGSDSSACDSIMDFVREVRI